MTHGPIRIALMDDHTLFRESLRRLLDSEPRYQVVAEIATVAEGIAFVEGSAAIDLALIDFDLHPHGGSRNGLAILRALREQRPQVRCIMVTAGMGADDLREVVSTLQAGVFLKSEATAELLLAIEKTMRGGLWISSRAALQMLQSASEVQKPVPEMPFTPREREVLGLITQGLSNKEIADRQSVSESAVKAMLQKLFAKTSVRSRSQLVRFVFESEMELP